MTVWSFAIVALIVGLVIAASFHVFRKAQAVARDDARFDLAPTIDHEPIVSELRRGGAI